MQITRELDVCGLERKKIWELLAGIFNNLLNTSKQNLKSFEGSQNINLRDKTIWTHFKMDSKEQNLRLLHASLNTHNLPQILAI